MDCLPQYILVPSFFFFFSSRRRHTRYWRDWSSDVCSSDLEQRARGGRELVDRAQAGFPVVLPRVLDDAGLGAEPGDDRHLARERGAEGVDRLHAQAVRDLRSEERRVGKEWRAEKAEGQYMK